MGEPGTFLNIGEFAKPASLLIEKISGALGGWFRPHQIRRVAVAEADAQIIKAKGRIKARQLAQRAAERFVAEQMRMQDNMESITRMALPDLRDDSKPQDVANDWVAYFFDKCRLISDEEMQSLWAKTLAGEANSPGKYSKHTVTCLASLDKQDAAWFAQVCAFTWVIDDDFCPIIRNTDDAIYTEHGITFGVLVHLDDIGLIRFDPLATYGKQKVPKHLAASYHGEPVSLEFLADTDNRLELGHVVFTQAGQQLAPLCKTSAVPGFLSESLRIWLASGDVVSSSPYPRNA